MNENRIAEIRKRHAFADEHKSVIRPSGFSWTIPGWQAHNDRATLLAEVERLREALHRVSLASQNSMSSKDECGRIAREALEAKP